MPLIRRCAASGIAIVLTATVAACGGSETDSDKLETTWALVQFQEGNPSDPLVASTMTLKDERVSGNGGVNDLTGGFKASDDGKLTFTTKAGSSMKAGPAEAMNQETRFIKSLDKVTTFEIDEEDDEHTELELKNELGQTVLVFLQVP